MTKIYYLIFKMNLKIGTIIKIEYGMIQWVVTWRNRCGCWWSWSFFLVYCVYARSILRRTFENFRILSLLCIGAVRIVGLQACPCSALSAFVQCTSIKFGFLLLLLQAKGFFCVQLFSWSPGFECRHGQVLSQLWLVHSGLCRLLAD